jgi:arsenate reductase
LLEEHGIGYRYREYTEEPLSAAEIREVIKKLKLTPVEVLRKRDPAYRRLGLTGEESNRELVRLMAANPTLLERPIGVVGKRAVVGRPPERLLEIV